MYVIFENRDMAFYSRNLLLSLRNSWKSTYSGCNQPPLCSLVWQTLTSLRIRASRRGQRGGNYLRQRSGLTIRPIVNLRRTGSEIPKKTKTKRVNYSNLLRIIVRNERLRMTDNYFHCKNDAHQLIFLPLYLG